MCFVSTRPFYDIAFSYKILLSDIWLVGGENRSGRGRGVRPLRAGPAPLPSAPPQANPSQRRAAGVVGDRRQLHRPRHAQSVGGRGLCLPPQGEGVAPQGLLQAPLATPPSARLQRRCPLLPPRPLLQWRQVHRLAQRAQVSLSDATMIAAGWRDACKTTQPQLPNRMCPFMHARTHTRTHNLKSVLYVRSKCP